AGFDLRPTITAGGNQEVVLILDTDLQGVAPVASSGSELSPNLRDNMLGFGFSPRLVNATASDGGADMEEDNTGTEGAAKDCPEPPHGWWTSDGLGLLRRKPARLGTAPSQLQRHFYPFNTATRLSGHVRRAPASESTTAWLTVFTSSP